MLLLALILKTKNLRMSLRRMAQFGKSARRFNAPNGVYNPAFKV
jgi:hypothetical protein